MGSSPTAEVKEPAKPTMKSDPAANAAPAGTVDKSKSDSARKLYSAAEQAFAAGDFRKAIELFRQADEQSPRAELEYNIALTYEAMGDKASALEAYRAYLRRAPTSADRSEVEANITRLAKDLGKIEQQQLTVVTSPAGATVLIDAQPRGFSPWTGEVPTGRHQLTVRRIGSQEAMQNVSMGVDQPVEVSLVLKEDPAVQAAEQARLAQQRAAQAERDRPTALQRIQPITWGLVGAGAAGLVGAGAFEQARANSEDDARLAATQVAAERELESAESQQTTARVLLGVGAGAMILGGVFLYIDLSREPDSATQLTAGCAGRRCGLYARGNW
jgi:tetratricopeptide (TPR) repeat protein